MLVDNEGRMLSLTYPNGGQTVGYSYDSLGRLSGMTDSLNNPLAWVNTYGPANELVSMGWTGASETRTYNAMLQMTRLQVSGGLSGSVDESYNYPAAGQNNGRIDSKTNNLTGETVNYGYDELNRLVSASVNGGWSRSWEYDGFGNRVAQTAGIRTPYTYDTATNRLTGLGNTVNYYQNDANGNMTGVGLGGSIQSFAYDVENRMVWAQSNTTVNADFYGYAADNKRVYKRRGDDLTEEISFYLGNRKLGVYQVNDAGYPVMQFTTLSTQLWFGGKKLAVRDRLGSAGGYFPYGEERSGSVQNSDSFATYYRDKSTGIDYADQRYYSASIGRFLTPDPYQASGGVGSPGSWNRYAYVEGDPVNYQDASGLMAQVPCGANWINDASLSGPCAGDVPSGPMSLLTVVALGIQSAGAVNGWEYSNAQGTTLQLNFSDTNYAAFVMLLDKAELEAIIKAPAPPQIKAGIFTVVVTVWGLYRLYEWLTDNPAVPAPWKTFEEIQEELTKPGTKWRFKGDDTWEADCPPGSKRQVETIHRDPPNKYHSFEHWDHVDCDGKSWSVWGDGTMTPAK